MVSGACTPDLELESPRERAIGIPGERGTRSDPEGGGGLIEVDLPACDCGNILQRPWDQRSEPA